MTYPVPVYELPPVELVIISVTGHVWRTLDYIVMLWNKHMPTSTHRVGLIRRLISYGILHQVNPAPPPSKSLASIHTRIHVDILERYIDDAARKIQRWLTLERGKPVPLPCRATALRWYLHGCLNHLREARVNVLTTLHSLPEHLGQLLPEMLDHDPRPLR